MLVCTSAKVFPTVKTAMSSIYPIAEAPLRFTISSRRLGRETEREFYFTPAKPWYRHMAATSEGGMSLRLRGESKVQARRPFYLSVVQLFTQGRVCVQIVEY